MNARSTKILLIAVLFLALAPGATIAACLQSGPSSCCCPDADCPEPVETRVDSGSCCKMSNRAPLPTTTPTTTLSTVAKPLVDAVEQVDASETTVASVIQVQEIKSARGLPSPVPLFTLHAALLI